jgi:A/G-specific adenine glycosylase
VWISEIMLQQTQVQTMLPYYRRFLARFPDVRSLAGAHEEEVLTLWAGLGYYRRARNLPLAAQKIIHDFGGAFPGTLAQMMDLPGIGRYTAGAIRSIAFNSPHPVVDGNVKRVMSRLHALQGRVRESYFWAQAEAWISRKRPADFNQAVMELGALICTRREPSCGKCPVRIFCAAKKRGIQDRIPARESGKAPEKVELVMLVLECAGSLLVTEKHATPYIPGVWALPALVPRQGESPHDAAGRLASGLPGASATLNFRGRVRHSITFRRLVTHVFHARLDAPCPEFQQPEGFRWIAHSEAGRLLTSALYRKALNS